MWYWWMPRAGVAEWQASLNAYIPMVDKILFGQEALNQNIKKHIYVLKNKIAYVIETLPELVVKQTDEFWRNMECL